MIIDYKNGERIVTNNTIADKIADANYYLGIAMASGNTRNKRKWLKRLRELNEMTDKLSCILDDEHSGGLDLNTGLGIDH